MQILSTRTICGPSVYHHLPVLVMKIDLQNWTEVASCDIPGFSENLIQHLPNLASHTCSPGYAGGFLERLERGTYMAHIIEHAALELSTMCGIGVNYGKTRYAGKEGHYEIITRFENEKGMQACLLHAVDLVEAAATSQKYDVQQAIDRIQAECKKSQLGPSGEALLQAARRRNIPYRRVSEATSIIQLGYGKKTKRIQTAITDNTSLVAADIAQDKDLTKKILRDHFLPVPEGFVVSSLKELQSCMQQLPPPYAMKPFDGHHGEGVSLNLKTWDEVCLAFEFATRFSEAVILEEMCQGFDFRILVVNGKMIAAAHRTPPFITGDGQHNIQQLIDQLNADPRRALGHDGVLTRIVVDDLMIAHLQKQNLSFESIPSENQRVFLRENANLSSGGTAADVTDQIHPEVKELCERTARVIGLDICGIDLIHDEPGAPVGPHTKIIEVNAGPGLRMHLSPSQGEARSVSDCIIETLYPPSESGRIPILSITGTNGKTTVARLLHKIFSMQPGTCVGLTTTDGIWIGSQKVFSGDTTGPKSAQAVLSDPSIDVAVLEVARGGLLRGGLAYDWSDVSVVTNVRADHIGQDGIEDIEDLVWIKSLVAERVRENGTLVLNADDPASFEMRNNPRVKRKHRNIFLYSTSDQNPAIHDHIAKGHSACWVQDGFVFIQHKTLRGPLFEVASIPSALGGVAEFQVSNIVAAVCAALASDVPPVQIIQGLLEFQPAKENRGRLNVYRIKDSYVILDYGHNQDAITSMGRMLQRLPAYRRTAVLSLPGDRASALLQETGKSIAPLFDHFILKDDLDLRGRHPEEVASLLKESIQSAAPNTPCEIIADENKAVLAAVEKMHEHEIVAIFYEDFDSVMKVLKPFDPLPVTNIQIPRSTTQSEEDLIRSRQENMFQAAPV